MPTTISAALQEEIPARVEQDDLASINAFLHSLGRDAVVLRNHDFKANLGRGGDIDILVADMATARKQMVNHLGKPWWRMCRTYVEGCFYLWGHLDLTPRMEWHGAVFISNQTLLDDAEISSFGFGKLRLAHEALICWFASLIWGGFFKERYKPIILEAAQRDGEAFERALEEAVGHGWGKRLLVMAKEGRPEDSVASVKELRRALWWSGFRKAPVKTTKGWLNHWTREVWMRLAPPVPWVAVLGPDGCGKSTVLAGIEALWGAKQLKTKLYHWRPEILRLGSRDAGPETNPHGKPPRGLLASLSKLAFLWLDWFVGFRGLIANYRAKGFFVIFDRHYLDLLVDPIRYRYGGPAWLARAVARLIPKPNAVILLDAPSEIVHARKKETSFEEAVRQREAYLKLVRSLETGHIVDCSQPPERVIAEVAQILSDVTQRYADAAYRRIETKQP